MKTISFISNKLALSVLLVSLISITASAQKYPKVQEVSLRAPENIKIDGKLAEWDGRLQAYSNADRIFYTISNDDNKLYVTIQTYGPHANDKILSGGITFTLSHYADRRGRLKSPDNVSVTYPLLYSGNIEGMITSNVLYAELKKDSAKNSSKMDSVMHSINKQFTRAAKEIEVSGVNEITDPVISIYNTFGIQAAAQFSNRMFFTYELAIPLKYLGLSANDASKFSYNIKLNGSPESAIPVFTADAGPVTAANGVNVIAISERIASPNFDYQYENSVTDFWGEYVLAKKP